MISWDFTYIDDGMKHRLRALCGTARDAETVTVRVGDVLALLRFCDDHATCEEDHAEEMRKAEIETTEEAFDNGAASRDAEIERLEFRIAELAEALAADMLADA